MDCFKPLKFTYDDGTIIDAQLRNRKNVREWVSHGANGMQDGHSVKYTFDLAYTKEFVEIIDESDNSHSISKFGDVRHLSDDKSLFGESSLYFDGNGDYLVVENSNDLNFGSSDYTVELWVNTPNTVSTNTNSATQIIGKHTTGSVTNSSWLLLHITASKRLQWQEYSGETSSNISVTIPDNTWVHIAVVKNNDTLKCIRMVFLNPKLPCRVL